MRRVSAGVQDRGGGATAAVLWLMILLVFLPIAMFHGFARYAQGGEVAVHAAAAIRPGS